MKCSLACLTAVALAVSLPSCAGGGGKSAGASGGGGAPVVGGAGGLAQPSGGNATSPAGGTTYDAGAGGAGPAAGGPIGGQADGGKAGGGSGSGGSSGGAVGGSSNRTFMLGADISSTQESNLTYRDVDGTPKPLLSVLKNHGFNYVRLKTFVDPSAPYGYSSTANGCQGLPESFGDRDHVIAAAKLVKQAGMGFLLDFHYSDTWADPGNQIIPEGWRGATSITQLAMSMQTYTSQVVKAAIDAGARPDMVQVGNEITAGLLMHVPGSSTDCWGNNPADAPLGGSTASWDNLATLLKAGIQGVRDVDPTILVMLHIENTDDVSGVRWWVDNARSRSVSFDVLGLSCYVAFQGQPSVWQATLTDIAGRYPDLRFAIAEYNPERAQANLIMAGLPDGRGLGTFFWEPTRSGDWGSALFSFQGNVATANKADFDEFDLLRPQVGL